jgi:hypothetical protein
MKTNLIHNLPIVAVMASLLLIPFSAPAACLALTFTGAAAMLAADYGREIKPVTTDAEIIAFKADARDLSSALRAA